MDSFSASVAAVSACLAEHSDSPPTVYIAEHGLSREIAGAFATGCSAETVELPLINPDLERYIPRVTLPEYERRNLLPTGPVASYGLLRGCGEVIETARSMRHDFWHIDNGYFRQSDHNRNDLSGYYRITRNGFQVQSVKERKDDRWKNLRISIRKTWNKEGRKIVVIPPSGFLAQYQRIDKNFWINAVTREIQKRTDRQIFVKLYKGRLEELWPDTHCVVTHESMAALHALLEGVPAIALGKHCIGSLSWKWENLEYPDYFDLGRVVKLCHGLAYEQWQLGEIRNGKAWRMLNE